MKFLYKYLHIFYSFFVSIRNSITSDFFFFGTETDVNDKRRSKKKIHIKVMTSVVRTRFTAFDVC